MPVTIIEGRPIEVFNHGHHTRDFTYVEDIVEGVVRVSDRVPGPDPAWNSANPDPASSSAPYRLYNIGSNRPIQLLPLYRSAGAVPGSQGRADHETAAAW